MEDHTTAEAACVVRVWVEPGDPVLRGRVVAVDTGRGVAARGVDELVAAVRAELGRLQSELTCDAEATHSRHAGRRSDDAASGSS